MKLLIYSVMFILCLTIGHTFEIHASPIKEAENEYILQDTNKGGLRTPLRILKVIYKGKSFVNTMSSGKLNPTVLVKINASEVVFPPLIVGTEAWQTTGTMSGIDPSSEYISNVEIVGSSDFAISENTCHAGGGYSSCIIEVEYTPTTVGEVFATVYYTYYFSGHPPQTASFKFTARGLPYEPPPECPDFKVGSKIKVDNQSLGESISIVGTDLQLVYSSEYSEEYITPKDQPYRLPNFNLEGWTVSIVHYYDVIREKLHLGTGNFVSRKSIELASGNVMVVNNDEAYVFDSTGKHLETKSSLTGAIKYSMVYNIDKTLAKIIDGYGNETTFQRAGKYLSSITSPYGQVTTIGRNSRSLITKITNPNLEVYQIGYYSSSELISSFIKPTQTQGTTFQYNDFGRLTLDQGIGGNKWTIAVNYDGTHPETSLTSALGRITYHSAGRNSSGVYERLTTKPSGFLTSYTEGEDRSQISTNQFETTSTSTKSDEMYGDILPRLSKYTEVKSGITRVVEYLKNVDLVDPSDPYSYTKIITTTKINDVSIVSTFNKSSMTTSTVDPEGVVTVVKLNDHERPISFQLGNDIPITATYDSRGRVLETTQGGQNTSKYNYNSEGLVASITNAINQVTSYIYDPAGRQVMVTLPDTRVIEYKYNADGKIIEITPPQKSPHAFSYNLMELIESYLPPFLSGEEVNTTYSYNLDKQLTSVNRPDGKSLNYNYNLVSGLLDSMEFGSGEVQVYTYFTNTEHASSITSPDEVQSSFSYFGMEDLASETQTVGLDSIKVSFTHDNFFRPTSRKLEVNSSQVGLVSTDYRKDNQPSLVGEMGLEYDSVSGRLTTSVLGKVRDTRTYDQFGNLKSYRAGFYPGTKCKTKNFESCATEFYSYQLTRDKLNRIIAKDEKVQGASSKYKYGYDSSGRLSWITKNGVTESLFNYDSNSNRVSGKQNRESFNANFDSQDRMLSYSQGAQSQKIFDYNENGELVSISQGDQITTFSPDVLGRLKSVALPDSSLINYKLDHEGRRAQKLINGSPVKRLVYEDTFKVAAELDPEGGIKEYVYATNINSADYMRVGATLYRIIKDHLGSPRFVVNARTGSIVQRMDYNEWGMVTLDTNPGFQLFGFAGGLYDQDTKLVKFGARDYDGSTGRWLSKDPILFDGGDTNLYGYVLQDPINFVDPSGKIGVAGVLVCGAAIIVVADKAAEIRSSKVCQKNNPDMSKDACDQKSENDGFEKNLEDILYD